MARDPAERVARADSVAAAARQVEERHGRLDALVPGPASDRQPAPGAGDEAEDDANQVVATLGAALHASLTPDSDLAGLAATVEALLFLSNDPVPVKDLAVAIGAEEPDVVEALGELTHRLDGHGLVPRDVAGGWAAAPPPIWCSRRAESAPRPISPG